MITRPKRQLSLEGQREMLAESKATDGFSDKRLLPWGPETTLVHIMNALHGVHESEGQLDPENREVLEVALKGLHRISTWFQEGK